MSDNETNEILKAVTAFHDRLPRATDDQARAEADRLFDELRLQSEFLAKWKKMRDIQARIREAESKALVDRVWPEDKYG